MNIAVLHGPRDLRIEQRERPPLLPGEVRVRIEAALTCGTDLKVFKRGYHARMLTPPSPFGHELAGVVIESATPQWSEGARVVAANSAPCGHCFWCARQQEFLCPDLLFLNGAYAEEAVIPARLAAVNLLPLRLETHFADAALTEPLACVVQGVEDAALQSGQSVLVIGAGPIGLMFVALARRLGCDVTVAGRGAQRLETARRLGAGDVRESRDGDDLAATLQGRAPGYDVVIEATGKPEVWEVAPRLVRKGGLVNFFGGCPAGTHARFDTGLVHYSALTFRSSFHHTPRAIRAALALIEEGVVRAKEFVDGDCALSVLPALFAEMADGNRAVKTLVRVRD